MKWFYGLTRSICVIGVLASVFVQTTIAETKSLLLVTPKGVFESQVVDGVPGPWKPSNVDVIVQGFKFNNTPPDVPPDTVPEDKVVADIAKASKATLKDRSDAVALASLINVLQKSNLSQKQFDEALELALPVADSSLNANGRLVLWHVAVSKISTDPAKLKAGLQSAFNISADTLETAATASATGDIPESAQVIQVIIDLLKTLGFI